MTLESFLTQKPKKDKVIKGERKNHHFRECFARPYEYMGETIVVDKHLDIIASKRKERVKPWIAEWIGTPIVEHGDTRDEAVEAIKERIRRKKAIEELREIMRKRMVRKAIDDLLEKQRGKKPGV